MPSKFLAVTAFATTSLSSKVDAMLLRDSLVILSFGILVVSNFPIFKESSSFTDSNNRISSWCCFTVSANCSSTIFFSVATAEHLSSICSIDFLKSSESFVIFVCKIFLSSCKPA